MGAKASLQPKSKNAEAAYVLTISFVGKDAMGIHTLTLAEKLSDIVFPSKKRKKDKDLMRVYEKAMKVWNLRLYREGTCTSGGW